MQVRAACVPGHAHDPNSVAGANLLPQPDVNPIQMCINCIQGLSLVAKVVPNGDRQAIRITRIIDPPIEPIARPNHLAIAGRHDRGAAVGHKIDPRMGRLIPRIGVAIPVLAVDAVCVV